ncbi:hypothetical protein [Cupriavidus sp. CuC1]|uniref:hypothetical protein n=1 Tax=Cupriavidus sp. CuC1 TaxID=3373131 RepID=UPI0037CF6BF3
MPDDDVLIGCLMEDAWLTLEQVAAACMVEPEWLMRHVDEGLFPHAVSVAGGCRFSSASLLRARSCVSWSMTLTPYRNWPLWWPTYRKKWMIYKRGCAVTIGAERVMDALAWRR